MAKSYEDLQRFVLRLVQGDAWEMDDVVQETYFRALSSGKAPPVERGGEAVATWLRAIARNVLADRHRRRIRGLTDPGAEEGELELDELEDERGQSAAARAEISAGVRKALSCLTHDAQEILVLRMQGWSIREIAAARGEHVERTKSTCRRALALLAHDPHLRKLWTGAGRSRRVDR